MKAVLVVVALSAVALAAGPRGLKDAEDYKGYGYEADYKGDKGYGYSSYSSPSYSSKSSPSSYSSKSSDDYHYQRHPLDYKNKEEYKYDGGYKYDGADEYKYEGDEYKYEGDEYKGDEYKYGGDYKHGYKHSDDDDDSSSHSDDDDDDSSSSSYSKKYGGRWGYGEKPAKPEKPAPKLKVVETSDDYTVSVKSDLKHLWGVHDKVECIAHLDCDDVPNGIVSKGTGKCAFAVLPGRTGRVDQEGEDVPNVFWECNINEHKLTSQPMSLEIGTGVSGNSLSVGETLSWGDASRGSLVYSLEQINELLGNYGGVQVLTKNSNAAGVEAEIRGTIFCRAHSATETSFSGHKDKVVVVKEKKEKKKGKKGKKTYKGEDNYKYEGNYKYDENRYYN